MSENPCKILRVDPDNFLALYGPVDFRLPRVPARIGAASGLGRENPDELESAVVLTDVAARGPAIINSNAFFLGGELTSLDVIS